MFETDEINYLNMTADEIEELNLSREQEAVICLDKAIEYCGEAFFMVVNFEDRAGQKFDGKNPTDTQKRLTEAMKKLQRARKLFKEEAVQLGGTFEPEAMLEDKTEGFHVN